MANKRRYGPRRVRPLEVTRFRGIYDDAAGANVPVQYVGGTENFISSKIRQIEQREGQNKDSLYSEGVNTGFRGFLGRAVGEGNSLWAEGFLPNIATPLITFPPPDPIDIEFPFPPIPDPKLPPQALFTITDIQET